MRKISIITLISLSVSAILGAFLGMLTLKGQYTQEKEYIYDTVVICKDLTDWELFTLATIAVESEYDTTAFNIKSGATGCLQITNAYIDEYNRLTNSELRQESVYDPSTSLLMWEYINEYYNPERNFEKAVYIHNPKAGDWYRKRIFNAMDDIERYENIRKKVIEICYGE